MSGRRHRIVIAGGGVAGLEALLALRVLAGTGVELVVVTPEPELEERPLSVAEPFGHGAPRRHAVRDIVAAQHAELRLEALREVRSEDRMIVLGSGGLMAYDSLIVATGASVAEAVPGALTFRGRHDVPAMRAVLDDLHAGRARSLALALPDASSWSVPLYELAAMAGAELLGTGATVTVVTPEAAPLELFGPGAAAALEPLLDQRDVSVIAGARPVAVRDGRLLSAGGGELAADRVVALARPQGRPIPGLPADAAGFHPVDRHGRVAGCPDVYAAGDVTAFPLKQGGLAAQQADAVAEAIAAELGLLERPAPFAPVLRGLLLAGGVPLYLRAHLDAPGEGRAQPLDARVEASGSALWWPPAKVAARYLGPWLATARPSPLADHPLADRPGPRSAVRRPGSGDAVGLALLLADCDARWGDYAGALRALEAAETLDGALPPAYERKRRDWAAAA